MFKGPDVNTVFLSDALNDLWMFVLWCSHLGYYKIFFPKFALYPLFHIVAEQ